MKSLTLAVFFGCEIIRLREYGGVDGQVTVTLR